jgi:hypothetical protein
MDTRVRAILLVPTQSVGTRKNPDKVTAIGQKQKTKFFYFFVEFLGDGGIIRRNAGHQALQLPLLGSHKLLALAGNPSTG